MGAEEDVLKLQALLMRANADRKQLNLKVKSLEGEIAELRAKLSELTEKPQKKKVEVKKPSEPNNDSIV